nr:immunoglobulin heavy chain junction region [Mus musculus]
CASMVNLFFDYW